jgi:hypothetical protein
MTAAARFRLLKPVGFLRNSPVDSVPAKYVNVFSRSDLRHGTTASTCADCALSAPLLFMAVTT